MKRRVFHGFLGRQALLTGLGVLLFSEHAQAGRQLEEPLADAVRSALSAAINNDAPPVPEFNSEQAQQTFERWLEVMDQRLRPHKPDPQARREFLTTLWYESKRAGLEASLVLGLIQVESNFRKFAVSSAGARGYMQVMPFWVRQIGDADHSKLFHMQTNLRFGCVILRHYLDIERGDAFMALGRYNGTRGKPEYPRAVLAAQNRWR